MFKRIALVLTFLAAFSLVGSALAPQAQAWRGGWGRPYGAYYAPPRAYSAYYGGYGYAAPRAYYYGGPRVYRSYYAPAPVYYGPGPGVAVSVGY